MSSNNKNRDGEYNAVNRLYQVLQAELPGILGLATKHEETFVSLHIKHRGDGDYLVVVKRVGDDGEPQVCFAVGFDFASAVIGSDRVVQAGKWRFDKPWSPNGSRD